MNMTIEQITAAYPNVAKLESQAGRELLAEVMGQLSALAVENVGLKAAFEKPDAWLSWHSIPPTFYEPDRGGEYLQVHEQAGEKNDDGSDSWPVYRNPETGTPATDAFLAELRTNAITAYADKRGFSFQHGSIHAHFGNGDVMVGSVTFENGNAGICFAPVREKEGGLGTNYEWTRGKTAEQVESVFVIESSNAEGLEVIQGKLADAIAQLRKGAAL